MTDMRKTGMFSVRILEDLFLSETSATSMWKDESPQVEKQFIYELSKVINQIILDGRPYVVQYLGLKRFQIQGSTDFGETAIRDIGAYAFICLVRPQDAELGDYLHESAYVTPGAENAVCESGKTFVRRTLTSQNIGVTLNVWQRTQ